MSLNRQLSKIFQQTAAALELLGENRFKVNANSRVARVVKEMTTDIEDFVAADPETALQRLTELADRQTDLQRSWRATDPGSGRRNQVPRVEVT